MTARWQNVSNSLACVTMRVREWNDTIVFLHEVVPGAADRSYGIHVAKLAGLPLAAVIARAEEVLRALEDGREGPPARSRASTICRCSKLTRRPEGAAKRKARSKSRCAVFPRIRYRHVRALDLLYALKAKLDT